MKATQLPTQNQYAKTTRGTTVWKVWYVDSETVALMHDRNGRGLRVTHEQFLKGWEIL